MDVEDKPGGDDSAGLNSTHNTGQVTGGKDHLGQHCRVESGGNRSTQTALEGKSVHQETTNSGYPWPATPGASAPWSHINLINPVVVL
ncbi:hypothetical protein P7K49_034037 [Saguinus oedipus]|uniref:Uncharacterized protein n=1 Tax=Saguinus oedipus TaxID=9490 RepID=A0ABQ9TTM0_SAGOE|nr:hypothetical protein P7K49_034037 [Saguinus oedipus]